MWVNMLFKKRRQIVTKFTPSDTDNAQECVGNWLIIHHCYHSPSRSHYLRYRNLCSGPCRASWNLSIQSFCKAATMLRLVVETLMFTMSAFSSFNQVAILNRVSALPTPFSLSTRNMVGVVSESILTMVTAGWASVSE